MPTAHVLVCSCLVNENLTHISSLIYYQSPISGTSLTWTRARRLTFFDFELDTGDHLALFPVCLLAPDEISDVIAK